jgi:hypothetical protein
MANIKDLPRDVRAQAIAGWFLQEFALNEKLMLEALGLLGEVNHKWPETLLEHLPFFRKLDALGVLMRGVITDKDERLDIERFVSGMKDAVNYRNKIAHYPFGAGNADFEVSRLKDGAAPWIAWSTDESIVKCSELQGIRRGMIELVRRLDAADKIAKEYMRSMPFRGEVTAAIQPGERIFDRVEQ